MGGGGLPTNFYAFSLQPNRATQGTAFRTLWRKEEDSTCRKDFDWWCGNWEHKRPVMKRFVHLLSYWQNESSADDRLVDQMRNYSQKSRCNSKFIQSSKWGKTRSSPKWWPGCLTTTHTVFDLRSFIWALAKAIRLFTASLQDQSLMCSLSCVIMFYWHYRRFPTVWLQFERGTFSTNSLRL